MYWRFEASQEEDVDVFLSRDCDSRLSERESKAVNEWILSNKDFHIMRDHPYHTVPILGGMWGSRNGLMRNLNIRKLIEIWRTNEINCQISIKKSYGDDQDFLGQIVYPLIINNAIEHCDFNLNYGGKLTPFPTIRENYEYVGDIFDENDNRHPEYWKYIKNIIG